MRHTLQEFTGLLCRTLSYRRMMRNLSFSKSDIITTKTKLRVTVSNQQSGSKKIEISRNMQNACFSSVSPELPDFSLETREMQWFHCVSQVRRARVFAVVVLSRPLPCSKTAPHSVSRFLPVPREYSPLCFPQIPPLHQEHAT